MDLYQTTTTHTDSFHPFWLSQTSGTMNKVMADLWKVATPGRSFASLMQYLFSFYGQKETVIGGRRRVCFTSEDIQGVWPIDVQYSRIQSMFRWYCVWIRIWLYEEIKYICFCLYLIPQIRIPCVIRYSAVKSEVHKSLDICVVLALSPKMGWLF